MRELIRHILKENRLQQELKQVIKDGNIFDAADLVGGISPLKKIFKDDPEMSSLFEKLIGRIIFDYYVNKEHIEFPLDYEIIGRKSNIHKTNHWPEINVLYDENKLTPEENGTFKSMIKNLADDAQHSGFKSKFDDGRIFNANYLTVVELNGEKIDSIWGGHYPWIYEVEEIYDKLYGRTESLNESNNRETDKNLRAINVLLSMVSWDGLCDIWAEYNPDDKEYEIRSKTVSSDDLFTSIDEIEKELNSLEDSIRSMGIRVYIYTSWYVDNCDDEVKFMNESTDESKSEDKKLNLVKEMIYDLFDEVKFIKVEEYRGKPLLKIYHDVEDNAANYDNWFTRKIQDEIEEMTSGNIILRPYWEPTWASWDFERKNPDFYIDAKKIDYDDKGNVINESEEKQPKYLNILKDLVKPFKDEDGVCDIKVSYDDDDDMYSVYIVMGTEEMNDKFFYVPMIQSHISKLRINVRNTIKDYLPIDNLYVGSYGKPNCNWNPLNESSIKEKSLVKLIEKDGLYDFIEMSGLDINQVRSLLKNIDNPKEILKQYIREFVIEHDGMSGENHGSIFALNLPLINTKYVNDILVQDSGQIAVEIIEYHIDEYGHREDKDQYLTSINNLTNEELLSIISWMMETIKGGYWF
jgi:hypothetical protein